MSPDDVARSAGCAQLGNVEFAWMVANMLAKGSPEAIEVGRIWAPLHLVETIRERAKDAG